MTALTELRERAETILAEVERAVVGKRDALELILLALLARRPRAARGLPRAREDADRALVRAGDLARFARIQFTPDLMPADVTGSSIFDQRDAEFVVPPRPDLHQPPARRRDQPRPAEDAGRAARGDAGAPGDDRGRRRTRSSAPFLVLATQNPIEYEGTYPLPEAQLDRFLAAHLDRLPGSRARDRDARSGVSSAASTRSSSSRWSTRATLVEMQRALEQVHVSDAIEGYIVDLVAATRESQRLAVGASPRGSIALLKLSRAKAALAGRDFVTPEDVKAVAVPALAHRLMLRPELWVQRLRAEDVVAEALETVPTPPAEDASAPPRRDRLDAPRRRRVRRARGGRPVAGLALGRVEPVALAAPFALAVVAAAAPRDGPELTVARRARPRAGARGRRRRARRSSSTSPARRRPRRASSSPLPARARARDGGDPRARRARAAASRATVELTLALRALGRVRARAGARPRARPASASRSWEARGRARSRCASIRARRRCARSSAPLETQVFAGNQVSRARGDGIEFADLRAVAAGRPAAAGQLAGQRAARRALGQRAAPRAKHGRRPLPRHVHRARAGRARHARPAVRAAASLAHRYLQRKDRVGVVELRRLSFLASARLRHAAALPDRRLAAADGRRAELRRTGIDILPPRTLPPKALVLALTPLLDDAVGAALLDLRARGSTSS